MIFIDKKKVVDRFGQRSIIENYRATKKARNMNSIIIKNFDDDLIIRLQKRAEYSGRSLEAEAKEILRVVLTESEENSLHLADKIKERFSHFGDIEIPIISRDPLREIPNFED